MTGAVAVAWDDSMWSDEDEHGSHSPPLDRRFNEDRVEGLRPTEQLSRSAVTSVDGSDIIVHPSPTALKPRVSSSLDSLSFERIQANAAETNKNHANIEKEGGRAEESSFDLADELLSAEVTGGADAVLDSLLDSPSPKKLQFHGSQAKQQKAELQNDRMQPKVATGIPAPPTDEIGTVEDPSIAACDNDPASAARSSVHPSRRGLDAVAKKFAANLVKQKKQNSGKTWRDATVNTWKTKL